jgi:hypothetical protein
MSYPGFQPNHQAQLFAQTAQASANRAAQQNAAYGASLNHRRTHYPTPRRGPMGLFGRLVSMIFTTIVLMIMAVVALVVLSSVDPSLVEPVWHWLDQLG